MQTEKSPSSIILMNLVDCSLEQQMAIRDIRNQEGIRTSMYTDHVISVNEHLLWINRLRSDEKQIVFAVLNEAHIPLGVVSINALDTLHKKSDWAFYLDTSTRGGGLGVSLEFALIEYAFEIIGLEKLNCEVIGTNEVVVKLHKKFGFKEEGFRRENIEKNGRRIGVYFLGLTKNDWYEMKPTLKDKYRDTFAKYNVQIVVPIERLESPITQIENARAKNNLNWMALLRLTIEEKPQLAKPIVTEILRLDSDILRLTRQIVGEISE